MFCMDDVVTLETSNINIIRNCVVFFNACNCDIKSDIFSCVFPVAPFFFFECWQLCRARC